MRHPPFFQFCSAKREIRVVFGVSQPLVHCIGETPLRLFATCVGYRRLQSASRVSHVFYSVLPPYGDTGRERYWSPLARRLSNRACRNCEFSCLNRSHSQRHRSHSAASQSSVLRCASRTTCRRNAGCFRRGSVIGRKATMSRSLVNGVKARNNCLVWGGVPDDTRSLEGRFFDIAIPSTYERQKRLNCLV